MDDTQREVPLTGGRVTRGVVRAGDTVRRPLNPGSERIHRLLAYFEDCGFDGAPRFLGIDARGREILSFIEGFAPPHNGFELTEEGAQAGARLVRRVHDLTAGTEFAAGSEVACHPNLAQQKVAASAYGWAGCGLADAMLAIVRNFWEINPEFIAWGAQELAYTERNVDLFRARLPA